MDLKEFLKLSKSANVIPVYKEINADLETPVSAFLKLKQSDYAFLLESVEGQEKIARFSFLGNNPALVFKSKGKLIEITDYSAKPRTRRFITGIDPLAEMRKIMREFKPVQLKGLPRFYGGLVGYIGYDAVRFFEKIPDKNPDDLKLADSTFMLTDTILIFDHINHTIKIVSNAILPKRKKKYTTREKIRLYAKAIKKIEAIEKNFNLALKARSRETPLRENPVSSNYKKSVFQGLISKAKVYIKRGDIIQVVLSQRLRVKIARSPFDIYRRLRSINPSPYMFYFRLKGLYLIGSSPEILVRCEDGRVEARPIAGTRPRGSNEEKDRRLEKDLLNSVKERAEHLMLVDLGRNDLGRVCKPGSVRVSDFMTVERYSHVMHLVTQVSGRLNPRHDIYDVLRASFPAGTVSGSPKIRAMEIIDELENSRRGPYAGCVGYFSFSHNMDTCITIRTIVIKDGFAYVQAGAGIVADSVPEKEYFETMNKARALLEALK